MSAAMAKNRDTKDTRKKLQKEIEDADVSVDLRTDQKQKKRKDLKKMSDNEEDSEERNSRSSEEDEEDDDDEYGDEE